MSHVAVNSILPANVYNNLIIDQEATERAELLELKCKPPPGLVQNSDDEAVVHRTLEIPGSEDGASICVDIAKAVSCPEPIKDSLVPLLWMVSNGSLVAYEYGFRGWGKSPERAVADISPKTWDSVSHEFSTYVRSAGIADIVSLKDKSCINGGEYVVPGMRALFRVPTKAVNLQPGSGTLESGWNFDGVMEPDGNLPECTDGHVTKTRQTSGGTVAHYHDTTEDGMNAFNPKEVAPRYTNAMWAAAKSEDFWAWGKMVDVAA